LVDLPELQPVSWRPRVVQQGSPPWQLDRTPKLGQQVQVHRRSLIVVVAVRTWAAEQRAVAVAHTSVAARIASAAAVEIRLGRVVDTRVVVDTWAVVDTQAVVDTLVVVGTWAAVDTLVVVGTQVVDTEVAFEFGAVVGTSAVGCKQVVRLNFRDH